MDIEFDKNLENSYDKLADIDKLCYQPASETTENAIKVEDKGWFALSQYDEKVKDAIVAVCKEWVFCIRESWGTDQDHDSGIYDVEHSKTYLEVRPANCVVVDGKVVALIDKDGRTYKLGILSTQWSIDKGWGSTVDYTGYSLSRRES